MYGGNRAQGSASDTQAHVSAHLTDTAEVCPVLSTKNWLVTQQLVGPRANPAAAHPTDGGGEPEHAPWLLRTAPSRLLAKPLGHHPVYPRSRVAGGRSPGSLRRPMRKA